MGRIGFRVSVGFRVWGSGLGFGVWGLWGIWGMHLGLCNMTLSALKVLENPQIRLSVHLRGQHGSGA